MANIYLRFVVDYEVDISEKAKIDMFLFESKGIVIKSDDNGYKLGKKWMDVTIAMWKEDIKLGNLQKFELCDEYPLWFILKIGL